MKDKKYPPLIQQYIEIQRQHPSAIVCCEVGSFFEIWGIDGVGYAREASQILDTVLTKRDKSQKDSPDMTGFPSISSRNHFSKLVQAGKTVVVVSQSIKGKKSDQNKSVTREITQILSPGTVVENLSREKSNYFSCIFTEDEASGICLIDVSTGEVLLTELPNEDVQQFLDIKEPSEVLLCGNFPYQKKSHQLIHEENDYFSKLSSAGTVLSSIYSIPNPTSNPTYSLTYLDLSFHRLGSLALSNLLNYLTEYNPLLLKKVSKPKIYSPENHLYLPTNAFICLDIFKTQSGGGSYSDTFIGILDKCRTAMGQRKLREWIQSPLTDVEDISARHNEVQACLENGYFAEELKDVYDFIRLSRKMAIKRLMPHEIYHLFVSLKVSSSVLLKNKKESIHERVEEIVSFIERNINLKEAEGISSFTPDFFRSYLTDEIKDTCSKWMEYDAKLKEYKEKLELELDCKGKLRIVEKTETISLVGPKSIVTKAKEKSIKHTVKASDVQISEDDWSSIAKNCLHYKQKFLGVSQSLCEQFQVEFIDCYGDELIEVSDKVAEIDILSSFAKISFERGYSRPKFIESDSSYINFKAMRHPVVELSNKLTEGFVPNDIDLGDKAKTLVIYGANSAGKSTILKALALNVIMAQIGCFVAAAPGAELTVFEGILTRMSSFDSLTEGLSTFTLEMTELQHALKHKGKKSLFLFDEIGRGTSVEDGEAIAYGTLGYLDDENNNSVALFATHYHKLVPSIEGLSSVLIKNVSCYSDSKGNLVFSRKLEDGPGSGSYGLEVAKSCGIPLEIINLASRYNLKANKLKQSRYNSTLETTNCENCEINPAQQTHHIVEQKQGKVKNFVDEHGQVRNINDKSNLVMLCATCHELVTRGTLKIKRKTKTLDGRVILDKEP